MLREFQVLVQEGIPSKMRNEMWLELLDGLEI